MIRALPLIWRLVTYLSCLATIKDSNPLCSQLYLCEQLEYSAIRARRVVGSRQQVIFIQNAEETATLCFMDDFVLDEYTPVCEWRAPGTVGLLYTFFYVILLSSLSKKSPHSHRLSPLTHAHTHTYMHTYAHARTHTNTHTHFFHCLYFCCS